jgi:hypothetical protein
MDDMSEDFAILKEIRKERRARRSAENVLLINASGLPCEYKRVENVYLFRDLSGPSCDFYPASGKWKQNGNPVVWHYGGAKSFINWYQKRRNQ